MHQRQMQAIAAVTKRNALKWALRRLQLTLACALHQRLVLAAKTDEVCNSPDLQPMQLRKDFQVWKAGHGAVSIHDFHQHTGGSEARNSGKINSRFRVACPAKDAFLAAAKMSPEIYKIAERSGNGVCTIGSCTTKPGIVTSVVEECRITLDQRHLDADQLVHMLQEAKDASERFAREGNVKVGWERLWQIAPRPFHDELIALCDAAIRETCGKSHRLPSGPLHDAAEVAAAGVPTVMMFVQSLHGISHNKIEDTKEEHLELCVTAFDKLAEKVMGWIRK